MGAMCFLKRQKERLLTLSAEIKTLMEATYYTATTTTFITLSIERKVCIIGVEIRQPLVKI